MLLYAAAKNVLDLQLYVCSCVSKNKSGVGGGAFVQLQ